MTYKVVDTCWHILSLAAVALKSHCSNWQILSTCSHLSDGRSRSFSLLNIPESKFQIDRLIAGKYCALQSQLSQQSTEKCWKMVTGIWMLFSHILGIIIPIHVQIFQRGWSHQPVENVPWSWRRYWSFWPLKWSAAALVSVPLWPRQDEQSFKSDFSLVSVEWASVFTVRVGSGMKWSKDIPIPPNDGWFYVLTCWDFHVLQVANANSSGDFYTKFCESAFQDMSILCHYQHDWLVVTGTWIWFSHILGMSSSQLTDIF